MTVTEGHEEDAEAGVEDKPMSVWAWINQEFMYGERYQPTRDELYLAETYHEKKALEERYREGLDGY